MGEIITMQPRAGARDSSAATLDAEQPGAGTVTSGRPAPAEGAILLLPIKPDADELDRTSGIMRAAVTYTALNGAWNGAWVAEHTGNSTVAGIVNEGVWERRNAALRRLTRLVRKAEAVRTVEIWSLASAAKVVMNQNGDGESGRNLEGFEIRFLEAVFELIERNCKNELRGAL